MSRASFFWPETKKLASHELLNQSAEFFTHTSYKNENIARSATIKALDWKPGLLFLNNH